jgi:hypothetical protein
MRSTCSTSSAKSLRLPSGGRADAPDDAEEQQKHLRADAPSSITVQSADLLPAPSRGIAFFASRTLKREAWIGESCFTSILRYFTN